MMEAKVMVLAHCQPIGFVLVIFIFWPKMTKLYNSYTFRNLIPHIGKGFGSNQSQVPLFRCVTLYIVNKGGA